MLRNGLAFESITANTERWLTLEALQSFIARVQAATDDQLKRLEY